MPKSIRFESAAIDSIRVVMIDDPWTGRKTQKQFTVSRRELLKSLELAGLYQKVPTTEADARLANEIAMYNSLCVIGAGPNRELSEAGSKIQMTLYTRILKALKL